MAGPLPSTSRRWWPWRRPSGALAPPLSDGEADIVDPYRRDASVFAAMTEQIMGSLPTIATALGRP